MKTTDETVCLVAGKAAANTKELCRLLAKQGVSAIVVEKEVTANALTENAVATDQSWSGKPGEDLFFNGWKLMF